MPFRIEHTDDQPGKAEIADTGDVTFQHLKLTLAVAKVTAPRTYNRMYRDGHFFLRQFQGAVTRRNTAISLTGA
ncbi:hypothetical protein D3C80_1996970 [compost metagenome]